MRDLEWYRLEACRLRARRGAKAVSTDDISEMTAAAINRRGVVAGLVTAMIPAAFSVAAPQAAAEAIPMPAYLEDERLMREALALAAEADFPFGAVIVRDGMILARGLNLGKRTHDPTAHGEMVAIRRCLADYSPETLKGTALYTSGA